MGGPIPRVRSHGALSRSPADRGRLSLETGSFPPDNGAKRQMIRAERFPYRPFDDGHPGRDEQVVDLVTWALPTATVGPSTVRRSRSRAHPTTGPHAFMSPTTTGRRAPTQGGEIAASGAESRARDDRNGRRRCERLPVRIGHLAHERSSARRIGERRARERRLCPTGAPGAEKEREPGRPSRSVIPPTRLGVRLLRPPQRGVGISIANRHGPARGEPGGPPSRFFGAPVASGTGEASIGRERRLEHLVTEASPGDRAAIEGWSSTAQFSWSTITSVSSARHAPRTSNGRPHPSTPAWMLNEAIETAVSGMPLSRGH